MFRFILLSVLLSLLFSQLSYGISSLIEPDTHTLEDGGEYFFNIDYCRWNVTGIDPLDNSTESLDEEITLLTFTSRCYCWYDILSDTQECSVPGPTLIINNGTSFSITVTNKLDGDDSNHTVHNEVKDPDVTNLHTHGLHISSRIDDVFIEINPGETHTYNYEILSSHYPGTHWYHAHHHGSTSYQIQGGLFGALIVKYEDEIENEIYDTNLLNMKSHILNIHWMHSFTKENCNLDTNDIRDLRYRNGAVVTFSYCWIHCSLPSEQNELSGLEYDFEGLNDYEFWLINQQFEPIINDGWLVNEYRILKFIGSLTEQYIQIEFNPYRDHLGAEICDYFLISRDGIYFKDGHRYLCDEPTFCNLIIPPGGRAEIIMRCIESGIYEIRTSTSNIYDYLSELPRSEDNITLLYIQIDDDDNIINNIVTELPLFYPEYPHYLKSLLHSDDEQIQNYDVLIDCPCYNFNESDTSFDDGTCGWDISTVPRAINGLEFDSTISQYYLKSNTIYEFYIDPNVHPIHQHVNPFQLTEDVGFGLLGQQGDWHDTMGHATNFTYRTITLDFTDEKVIIHCHILIHEDEGMMTYYTIVDELNGQYDCPTESPTDFPTDHPTEQTSDPTEKPTNLPTKVPTKRPSEIPSSVPTLQPQQSFVELSTHTKRPTFIKNDPDTVVSYECPIPCSENGEACSCSSVENCKVCIDGQGCCECDRGYFQPNVDYSCMYCQDIFGDECLSCTSYVGCDECHKSCERIFDEECQLWACYC